MKKRNINSTELFPDRDDCTQNRKAKTLKKIKQSICSGSAVYILLIVICSTVVGEILIDLLSFSLPHLSQFETVLFDSTLLLISTIPILYIFVYRPITDHIAERKQAEEALKTNLSSTEAILESIHNGILVVSPEGTVLKSNAKFAEMWQIPDDIMASGNDKVIMDSVLAQLADPDVVIEKINELYKNTKAESIDSIYLKDGRVFKRISRPKYLDGEPKGRVWSFLDITERITAEEALRKSEAHLQTLLQTLPTFIWLKDVNGVYLSCNKMFEQLVGTREAEIVGKTDYDLFSSENAEFFRKNDRNAIAAGKPTGNEEWHTFADDGHFALFDVIKTPMYDSTGTFIGVLGIGHDITKRKQLELALRDSEDKFSKAFLLSPYAITIVSAKDGKFIEMNDAFISLSGFTREEALGRTSVDLNLWANVEDRNWVLSALFEGRKVEGKEFQFKGKSGEIGTGLFSAQIIHLNNEPFILSSINDITDRKQTEAEIKLKNEELQKINAEKDKFFSIIAHDLRSPFNGFLGLTQIMAKELPSLKMIEIQEIAEIMKRSATNLFRLLENLLEWARVKQGLIPFEQKLVDLLPIVDESIEVAQESAKTKEIKIAYDVPNKLKVFADTNGLQTIIRNLVSNAVKFTSKGGKISVSAKATDNKSVEISVKDTGIGMSCEMINNLFRLDVQTNRKGTEDEPSSGLGLLLCKEFVEKQGGRIWVESEEGKGSIFYFTLPYNTEPEERIIIENIVPVDVEKNQMDKLKILIAEDDETSAMLISLGVEKYSKVILEVRNGIEAVDVCRNNPDIDLILMDIQLPKMDGYEATRQIRQFNKDVVIIAQTAYALVGDREKAIAAGCNDYISKPISKDKLRTLIQKYF
jgi:PAS domain S-box-containing protein